MLGRSGEVLQTGTVNGLPVEVAPGEYTVRVLGTPAHTFDRVTVESARTRELELTER